MEDASLRYGPVMESSASASLSRSFADLEAFIASLLSRWSPATASTRYKQLQALYRWLEDEEEIAVNPMARMKPPVVPDRPIPVVPEEALRRRLAACAGRASRHVGTPP